MPFELRLFHDRLAERCAPVALPDVAARAIYVIDGALALHAPGAGGTRTTLAANSAVSAGQGAHIGAGSQAASVLRWELVAASSAAGMGVLHGVGVESTALLTATLDLGPLNHYLLRCDRVDFPPGGEALLHMHQGGGIRCLLAGSIRIDTEGHSTSYAPLQAWFEAGPDPVYAAAYAQQPSAFARVMILPRALLGGQSSIRYVNPEDLERPKSQRYQLLLDEPLGGAA